MKKRYWTILTAALLVSTATTCSAKETPAEAESYFASVLYDVAQTERNSGQTYITSDSQSNLLKSQDAWMVTIDEQNVIFETPETTYVLDADFTDSTLSFVKAIAYKYAFDQFVAEEIRICVNRSDLGSFTVTDSNFDDYADTLAEMGYSIYGDDAEEFIDVLAEKLGTSRSSVSSGSFQNDSFNVSVPSGSFQNDSFNISVPSGSIQNDLDVSDSGSYAGSYTDDYCEACHNTGLCENCHGASYVRNPYDLTKEMDCLSCEDGKCPVCGGR